MFVSIVMESSDASHQFTCVGCRELILDQFVLRVAPDMEWHVRCLRCTDCQQLLDETCTCFVRDGKVYCKPDYVRSAASSSDIRALMLVTVLSVQKSTRAPPHAAAFILILSRT